MHQKNCLMVCSVLMFQIQKYNYSGNHHLVVVCCNWLWGTVWCLYVYGKIMYNKICLYDSIIPMLSLLYSHNNGQSSAFYFFVIYKVYMLQLDCYNYYTISTCFNIELCLFKLINISNELHLSKVQILNR